jgi:Arc/MetJ family transcription regulator
MAQKSTARSFDRMASNGSHRAGVVETGAYEAVQGRIDELTAATVLRIECNDPARATVLLRLRADVASVREEGGELFVTLASRDPRAVTAYIAYVLFDSGFQLYRLQLDHA